LNINTALPALSRTCWRQRNTQNAILQVCFIFLPLLPLYFMSVELYGWLPERVATCNCTWGFIDP
jgi:hypothetical protein